MGLCINKYLSVDDAIITQDDRNQYAISLPDFSFFIRQYNALLNLENKNPSLFFCDRAIPVKEDSAIGILSRNRIVIAGGTNMNKVTNQVYILNFPQKIIQQIPSLPYPTKGGSLYEVRGSVFLAGAVRVKYTKSGKTMENQAPILKWKLQSKKWVNQSKLSISQSSSMENLSSVQQHLDPMSISDYGTCLIHQKIYLIGGIQYNKDKSKAKPNMKIYSFNTRNCIFQMEIIKCPFPVLRPVCVAGEGKGRNIFITGGLNPLNPLQRNRKAYFVSVVDESLAKSCQELPIDLMWSHPCVYTKCYVLLLSYPRICVYISKTRKWHTFTIDFSQQNRNACNKIDFKDITYDQISAKSVSMSRQKKKEKVREYESNIQRRKQGKIGEQAVQSSKSSKCLSKSVQTGSINRIQPVSELIKLSQYSPKINLASSNIKKMQNQNNPNPEKRKIHHQNRKKPKKISSLLNFSPKEPSSQSPSKRHQSKLQKGSRAPILNSKQAVQKPVKAFQISETKKPSSSINPTSPEKKTTPNIESVYSSSSFTSQSYSQFSDSKQSSYSSISKKNKQKKKQKQYISSESNESSSSFTVQESEYSSQQQHTFSFSTKKQSKIIQQNGSSIQDSRSFKKVLSRIQDSEIFISTSKAWVFLQLTLKAFEIPKIEKEEVFAKLNTKNIFNLDEIHNLLEEIFKQEWYSVKFLLRLIGNIHQVNQREKLTNSQIWKPLINIGIHMNSKRAPREKIVLALSRALKFIIANK